MWDSDGWRTGKVTEISEATQKRAVQNVISGMLAMKTEIYLPLVLGVDFEPQTGVASIFSA
jgi:hypothetical protein